MNTTFLKAVIILSLMWGLAFHFPPSGNAGEVEAGEAVVVNPGQANTKPETLLPIPVTGKQKGSDDGQTASTKETVSETQKKNADPKTAETQDPSPALDRRWIIKMDKKPIVSVKKKEIVYTDKSQKQSCEVIGSQLREALQNVKYFTVRGDECSIVKHAEAFLKLKDQCEKECPETFFESQGYNPAIVRNVHTLLGLGRKRCLGESSGQSSIKKADKP